MMLEEFTEKSVMEINFASYQYSCGAQTELCQFPRMAGCVKD